jgi:hypothetical protein
VDLQACKSAAVVVAQSAKICAQSYPQFGLGKNVFVNRGLASRPAVAREVARALQEGNPDACGYIPACIFAAHKAFRSLKISS